MKITKPKSNQLLIEDNCLKQFNLKVNSDGGLNNSGYNMLYNGFILAYRQPDMNASKQIFYGNQLTIMTLFCSCLESLLRQKVITKEQLNDMVLTVKESIKENNE